MRVRLATPDDAAAILKIYRPVVTESVTSFETEPPSVADMRSRIESGIAQYPWLVAEAGGVLGYAYAGPHRSRPAYVWSTETSVYISPTAQRRGLGTTLYRVLLELLVDLGFHRAYAGITLPNPASVGLHEALGFSHLATYHEVGYKHGAWHDVGWYERDLAATSTAPVTPASRAGHPLWAPLEGGTT